MAEGGSRDRLAGLPGVDLWGFLLFSHGWTWGWWGIAILGGYHAFRGPGLILLVIGGLGLPIGGVVMTWVVEGRAGLRDLRNRLVDPTRIPVRWWVTILLLWPAIAVASAAATMTIDGSGGHLTAVPALALTADPVAMVATLGMILLIGPLPEEIGWRGYWLDRLQRRWSALTASLVLGVAWAVWHAPLFVLTGYFETWDFAPDPLAYGASIVLGAVLYTWVYNNTDRSVLGAIVFHFAGNATGQLLDLSLPADRLQLLVTGLLVAILVITWGPRTLRGKPPYRGSSRVPGPQD